MTLSRFLSSLLLILALPAGPTFAQQCDAYFAFDGTLADASGNGYDGQMIGEQGAKAAPQFVPGRSGQALALDGTSAMRAFVDLHYDTCPQVTVAAWVRVDAFDVRGTQYLLSTGSGHGPGLSKSSTNLTLSGTANGLRQGNAIRDNAGWMFVAGVYDYTNNTYTLYARNRSVTGEISANRRPPEEALWVGAFNDGLAGAATGVVIDELRVIGRALTADEVRNLQAADTPSLADLAARDIPQPITGISEQFSNNVPNINGADLPTRVPNLSESGGTSLAERPFLEPPPTVGTEAGVLDPELTMPDNLPGQQLAEDIQTAREADPVFAPPVTDIVCERPAAVSLHFSGEGQFPDDFVAALLKVRECKLGVRVVVLNGSDQWIISTSDQIAHSTNLSDELAMRLYEFERDHGGLDAADIAKNGAWMIAADNEFAHFGIAPSAVSRIQSIVGTNGRIASFSINPSNYYQWLLVDDKGNVFGDDRPPKMLAEISWLQSTKRIVHEAHYMPDGSWVLLGSDLWFASDGLTDSMVNTMAATRRAGRQIEHLLGYGSTSNFAVISNGPQNARNSDPVWQFEHKLAGSNIWSRMWNYRITGVSIAMVRNNQIEWIRGYGWRDQSDMESYVNPDTTFDVASVSKPIAAFGLLQLVEDGKLDLEQTGELQDIESIIPSLRRPGFRDDVRPEAGNVAQVLQHCAGFCYEYTSQCQVPSGPQGGAAEYDLNATMPTTAQVILGSGPAKASHRLVRTANVGVKFDYTSANYMLVQALIDIHGGGYLAHMGALLTDLDMVNSTYRSPYPLRTSGNFARGYDRRQVQPSVAYAEMAAASLVSTSGDLARFVIAVNQLATGTAPARIRGLLEQGTVDKFLGRDASVMDNCARPGNMALGINHLDRNGDWNNNETFWHGGVHNGYRALMVGLPGKQSGLVAIMTGNVSDAGDLLSEMRASMVAAYGL